MNEQLRSASLLLSRLRTKYISGLLALLRRLLAADVSNHVLETRVITYPSRLIRILDLQLGVHGFQGIFG